jgi:hypothetical protein
MEDNMKMLQVTFPIQRKDVDEQAFAIIDAELYDHDYYITHIEDEEGNDITHWYTDKEIGDIAIRAFEIVNQERNEYLVGMAESRYDG